MGKRKQQAKQLESSAVAELLKRPGTFPKMEGGSGSVLRQARIETGSARLQEALSRSPLFRKEVWARLVLSSLVAINKLLGEEGAEMPGHRVTRKSIRKPFSGEKVQVAHEMLQRLLKLLGEVTEQRVAASLVLSGDGRKRLAAQARRVIDERRTSLISEQDAVLYPSQVFTKENPLVRLR